MRLSVIRTSLVGCVLPDVYNVQRTRGVLVTDHPCRDGQLTVDNPVVQLLKRRRTEIAVVVSRQFLVQLFSLVVGYIRNTLSENSISGLLNCRLLRFKGRCWVTTGGTHRREMMTRRDDGLRDCRRLAVVAVAIACFLSGTRTTEAGRTSAQKAPQPERMALWIDGKQIERFAGKQSLIPLFCVV